MSRRFLGSCWLMLVLIGMTPVFADQIPEPFETFVTDLSKPCSYLPLVKIPEGQIDPPETISSAQAREDIHMLKYLLETAYSGFHFWSREGIDFAGLFSRLNELCEAADTVSVKRFEQVIAEALSEVQDGHLSMSGHDHYGFFRHQDAYFADLLVEKTPEGLKVIDSRDDAVRVGELIKVSRTQLLPTLSPKDKEHFLVGILSKSFRDTLSVFKAGGERVHVRLHPCRLQEADFEDEGVFRFDAIEGIPHVRVRSFSSNHHEQLTAFERTAGKLQGQKNVILNLWGNGGGSSTYGEKWVTALNGFALERVSFGMLFSPAIIEGWANEDLEKASPYLKKTIAWFRSVLPEYQKNPQMKWDLRPLEKDCAQGGFPGRVIVLVNRHVASSGELTTSFCRSFPHHLIVGENTAGIGTFGEVRSYLLPHSRIFLGVPSKLFLEKGIREGRGALPHYWLDTSRPLDELARWIKAPESYQFSLDVPADVGKIDFETWVNGMPLGLRRTVGVQSSGESGFGQILPDEANAVEGKRCALLTGGPDAKNWHYFFCGMPRRQQLSVSFSVKTENLKKLEGQFGNSYVGFLAETKTGGYDWHTVSFKDTNDWKRHTITIPWKREYRKVQFGFMLSISGKLWLDDVRFSHQD